jgi:hypothetical protein
VKFVKIAFDFRLDIAGQKGQLRDQNLSEMVHLPEIERRFGKFVLKAFQQKFDIRLQADFGKFGRHRLVSVYDVGQSGSEEIDVIATHPNSAAASTVRLTRTH